MKIKFKQQQFQHDAVQSVVDAFAGQPNEASRFALDKGRRQKHEYAGDLTLPDLGGNASEFGYRNAPVRLLDHEVHANIQAVQRRNGIKLSERLEGKYNLTVEMETGTGKTYTYIRTMYELYKKYGWGKFIVVVPSIAIREGVLKTFRMTEDHFIAEYGTKARVFVYNSKSLTPIETFASDAGVQVMIINSQAFAATGKDARRIHMELDDFQSRRPIDVIASANPILVIDEPQSVQGKKTKEALAAFRALFTLRYSATHLEEYNKVYRLDAIDAYNMKLVKKIGVKGISVRGSTGADGYVYLEGIDVSSKKAPVARIEFEVRSGSGIGKKTKRLSEGDDLYRESGSLEQYRGYRITQIDGQNNTVTFLNGETLQAGDVQGDVNEQQLRRIQIRETIKSHFDKERALFHRGIKVLSLFFIDEVAKYRLYDQSNRARNGVYADTFEEEYAALRNELLAELEDGDPYAQYLNRIPASKTHKGYFAVDKRSNRLVDPEVSGKASERESEPESNDEEAYELIMRDKERLLSLQEDTRFIFSHSALREGWDNPNVFQICTLKHSDSTVRKRQEVGRGLRLCVNQQGERMDADVPGIDVHAINALTVVASESYEQFAKSLQREIAAGLSDRPRKADLAFFVGKKLETAEGAPLALDDRLANRLRNAFIRSGYVDDDDLLTDEFFEAVGQGSVRLPDEFRPYEASVIRLMETIYVEGRGGHADNERARNVRALEVNDNFHKKEFQELWARINKKSVYTVRFDSDELVRKCAAKLDASLTVPSLRYSVKSGELARIESVEQLKEGEAFVAGPAHTIPERAAPTSNIKYDLVGKLMDETRLTRKTVAAILKGIREETFLLFRKNPEEFIRRAAKLINEEKATTVIRSISYDLLNETYDADIFTRNTLRGQLGRDAVPVERHIYDYLVTDSGNERRFARDMDVSDDIHVYAKLPRGFFISTPVGEYNPDWAIVFKEQNVKHIYFVAETKGSMSSMDMRGVEEAKIECARKHFAALNTERLKYDVVDSYEHLLDLVKS